MKVTWLVFLALVLVSCTTYIPPITPLPSPRPTPPMPSHIAMKRPGLRMTMFKLTPAGAVVMLDWDAVPDPSVAGYKIYLGPGISTYTNKVDAGNNTSVTISNLTVNARYYFAATSYTGNGLESIYSSEVSYLVPSPTNQAMVDFGIALLSTTDVNTSTTNWGVYTNLGVVSIPKPKVPTFFQSRLSITNR